MVHIIYSVEVGFTSEKTVLPLDVDARTRSPTFTAAMSLLSPDSNRTVSVPAKQEEATTTGTAGAMVGATVGGITAAVMYRLGHAAIEGLVRMTLSTA